MSVRALSAAILAALLVSAVPAAGSTRIDPLPMSDAATPQALVEETQLLIDAGLAVVTPDLPEPAAESQAEPVRAPDHTHADDVADLDGDGLADVIAHLIYEDGSADWVALRGTDGEELYRFAAQPDFTYLASLETDVDGDGLSELLERRFESGRSYQEQFEGSTCDDCPEGTTKLFESFTTISVRSGSSGDVLWTSEVMEDVEHGIRIDDGDSYRSAYTRDDTRIRGVLDGQLVVGHRFYDGEVVQSFTAAQEIPDTGTLRAGREQGHRALTNTITYRFIDLTDGQQVREVPVEINRSDSYASDQLGDFDGDGNLDVFVEAEGPTPDEWDCAYVDGERAACVDPREDQDWSFHLQTVSLTTGETLWQATPPADTDLRWFEVVPDADGDSGDDLLVDRSFGGPVGVWSGATGDVVWERPIDGFLDSLGHVDGELVLAYTEHEAITEPDDDDPLDPFDGGESEVGRRVHRVRISGADGRELFRTTSEPQDGATHVTTWYGRDDDYDGDGTIDLWVDERSSVRVEDEEQEGVWVAEPVGDPIRYLESGATGAVIQTGLPSGDFDDDVYASSVRDLDGDGGAELRVRDRVAGTTTFVRGTGGTLWTAETAGYISFKDDIDGDGGADLLEDDDTCAFTVRNGASGAVVWSRVIC